MTTSGPEAYRFPREPGTTPANYDVPVWLLQDLTTINVTADQITVRQAKTDLLAWAPPPSAKRPDSQPGPPSEAQRPAWLTETRLQTTSETAAHSSGEGT